MNRKNIRNIVTFIILLILTVVFLAPIAIVFINSFKGTFYISDAPFGFPTSKTFAGVKNYINGISKTGFLDAIQWSLVITVVSVIVILLFTSMTAWYITRVKSKTTNNLYYIFVFSMIVPCLK